MRSVRGLRGLDGLVQLVLGLMEKLFRLRPVACHVVVIGGARPFHLVDGLDDVLVHLVEVVSVVDLVRQRDGACAE